MDHQQLSMRLKKVADFVPKGAKLADIGSDHAYLPAYLVINQQILSGIAGEVVKGPFESAKSLVNELDLSSVIDVRLGDGLDVLEASDCVSVITICGMGGTLIRDILERGKQNNKLTGHERLILQPNIGSQVLRSWLSKESYVIIDELIIKENGKIYEIIVADKSSESSELSEKEQMFGPVLLQDPTDIFKEKWLQEKDQFSNILKQLEQSRGTQDKKIKEMTDKITLIEEVLS